MYDVLKGERFLVVGGSSGIGFAVAQQAAKAGASVTIASRSRSKPDAALADLASGTMARSIDTADYAAIESFFAGEPAWDHVVVSAAQTTSGPLRKSNLADARATMESKFWGAYHVARAAKVRDGGSLCFISGFRAAERDQPPSARSQAEEGHHRRRSEVEAKESRCQANHNFRTAKGCRQHRTLPAKRVWWLA